MNRKFKEKLNSQVFTRRSSTRATWRWWRRRYWRWATRTGNGTNLTTTVEGETFGWWPTPSPSLDTITKLINITSSKQIFSEHSLQNGALSLVGIFEIVLSLVEIFMELKYFHDVATPALLCHKEPARRIQSPLLGALKHKILPFCSSLVLYGIRDRWLPCTERIYYRGALMP